MTDEAKQSCLYLMVHQQLRDKLRGLTELGYAHQELKKGLEGTKEEGERKKEENE